MCTINPLSYIYCIAKTVHKDRILCTLLHNSCRWYCKNTVIARYGLVRISVSSQVLLGSNSRHSLLQSTYSANAIESEFESPSPISEKSTQDVLSKVKYNCILSENTMKMGWIQQRRVDSIEMKKELKRRETERDLPFSLKYIDENIVSKTNTTYERVVLPFNQESKLTCVAFKKNETYKFYSNRSIDIHSDFSKGVIESKDWLKNHEFYNDDGKSKSVAPWHLNYGTPDRSIPFSKVPCGGCGAYLQCQDAGIPGYLPSELIKNCTTAELRALKCQRCHFLEQYNMALNLNVSPDEYPRLLAHLKNECALAVLLVDLMDFPCSLWPGILEIIGTKRPVIVVGNKVDLLPSDSPEFLQYAKSWLEQAVQKSELANANVEAVNLVSAQTGFGVEELITKMHTIWRYQGDVYLLGCTNVGKSTLFNALLQSDYCKVQAVDIMLRATTSPWPGTTLSLLKFPIFRPEGWRLYQRLRRLQALQAKRHEELQLLRQQLKKSRNPLQATLIGHIGRTFLDLTSASSAQDPFSMRPSSSGHVQLPGLDPNHKHYVTGRWCYDTPGTIHPDQIIDILTAQELVYLLPREMILPRTFNLYPGDSILIAGVGRLDFEGGAKESRFTVFAASTLPITVCRTSDVDLVYKTLAASNLLIVPSFKAERLSQWPGLTVHPIPFEITGIHEGESAADIVLSSAGWIAVTPMQGHTCVMRAWTPFARGIHCRQPALLRFSVNLRGKKVRKSPAYLVGKAVRV